MKWTTNLREKLISLSGYWFYKHKDLPVGCDLVTDLKRIALPMETIFDVGANVGQTALFFSHYFRHSKIFSFEPVKDTFIKVKNNTAHLSQVQCYHLALGNRTETKELRLYEKESALNSLNEVIMNNAANAQTETISITTGDQFCQGAQIDKIDLLKIDTEGYELQVLEGLSVMLKNSKVSAVYCEVGFNPGNIRNTYFGKINAFLYQYGFSFYGMYNIRNESLIKLGYNYGNILYLNNEVVHKLRA